MPSRSAACSVGVRGLGEEAAAERLDRALDADAQFVERAGAVALRRLRPALQPALLGRLGLEARLVGAQPQQREVLVGLGREDRLEVELDVGLRVSVTLSRSSRSDSPLVTMPQRRSVERLSSSCTRLCGDCSAAPRTPAVRRSSGTPAPTRWIGQWLLLAEDRSRSCPRSRRRAAGRAGRSRAPRRAASSQRSRVSRPACRPPAVRRGRSRTRPRRPSVAPTSARSPRRAARSARGGSPRRRDRRGLGPAQRSAARTSAGSSPPSERIAAIATASATGR